MASFPVGGLIPPLSSQLNWKPNDAEALNAPTCGGSCPPPRPVHAVSTTASRPPTPSSDRRIGVFPSRAEGGSRRGHPYPSALPLNCDAPCTTQNHTFPN